MKKILAALLMTSATLACAQTADELLNDGKNSERGLEYDTMSDRYARFINDEVFAAVLANPEIRAAYPKLAITANPWGRATMGCSSGGAAALTGGHPDYVPQACEKSLKQLGVDVIDIYGLHRVDATVPIEDTVGAMSRLVEQGKVRFLGLSEAGASTIRRAFGVHPLISLETEYSLWSRDIEGDILSTCRQLGMAVMAYSPLEQARLLKQKAFVALAARSGATPAQFALAWLLGNDDVIVIPKSGDAARVRENAAALEIKPDSAQRAELDRLFPPPSRARALEML